MEVFQTFKIKSCCVGIGEEDVSLSKLKVQSRAFIRVLPNWRRLNSLWHPQTQPHKSKLLSIEERFEQRVRRGIDRCMSRSEEHLKDEVSQCFLSWDNLSDRRLGFQSPGCYCWCYSWVDS